MVAWWNSLGPNQRSAIIAFAGSGCGLILSTVVPYLQSMDRPCCMALGAILSVGVNALKDRFLKSPPVTPIPADGQATNPAS